jgi:hypothetical protein
MAESFYPEWFSAKKHITVNRMRKTIAQFFEKLTAWRREFARSYREFLRKHCRKILRKRNQEKRGGEKIIFFFV